MASYRHFTAEPAVGARAGNLGTSAEHAAREDAICGSNMLARKIKNAGLMFQPPREKRSLSFEEQLALVEAGRAQVVDKPDLRSKAPDRTLGGVSDWGSL